MIKTQNSQVVTIEPGDNGADYVALSATGLVTIARLKAMECRYAIRYIARRTSIGKIITPKEITDLHNAGIAILLNYEGSTTDYVGGAPAGQANGAWSRQFADSLGYPIGLPLFCSIDTDIYAANSGTARAYLRAFMAAANPYRPAVYGDVDVMREVKDLDPVNWRANAVGWGRDTSGLTIHVQQGRQDNGIDPNECLAPFNAWLPHQPVVIVPPKPEIPTPITTPGGPIMNVLFEIIDPVTGAKAAAAEFYSQVDAKGNALWCEWTGPGDPSTVSGRRLAAHIAAGIERRQIGLGSLLNMRRLGPVPTGDYLRVWSPHDFGAPRPGEQ